MGLFNWLLQLVGWGQPPRNPSPQNSESPYSLQPPANSSHSKENGSAHHRAIDRTTKRQNVRKSFSRVRLNPTRYRQYKAGLRASKTPLKETKGAAPYRYARYGSRTGHYLDLSRDGNESRLQEYGLPLFRTPEELANWIGLPLNRVAWLVHRFTGGRPETDASAHYHYHWVKKRMGGWRLIESPKSMLKSVQAKILRELLDKIPVHATAHGFVQGRSILTNAFPHVGQGVLVKFDLANFYTTVSFSRVVAIFRALGYSRSRDLAGVADDVGGPRKPPLSGAGSICNCPLPPSPPSAGGSDIAQSGQSFCIWARCPAFGSGEVIWSHLYAIRR